MSNPLKGLDAVDWANLEEAYGRPEDVPALLRAIHAGDVDAVGTLHAHVFHQSATYYPSAAPTVPFLVALAADPSVTLRVEVLGLLADFTGGHPEIEVFEPFVFKSTRASPRTRTGRATVSAIEAGRATLQALLDDDDPAVRTWTAYLLAGLKKSKAKLFARDDDDPQVAASLLLARAKMGARPATLTPALKHPDERVRLCALLATAEADTPDVLERLEAAALYPATSIWAGFPWLPSFGPLAARALLALDPTGAADRLIRVMDARLERGDQLTVFTPAVDSVDGFRLGFEEKSPEDAALRAIVDAIVPTVFAPLADRTETITPREHLDERMQHVLRWTVDHGLSAGVKSIPWYRPEKMRQYLDGDGPLEAPLTVADQTLPVWMWLRDVKRVDDPALVTLVESLTPAELLALMQALLTSAYNPKSSFPCLRASAWQAFEPKMIEHLDTFLPWFEALNARADRTVGGDTALLVARVLNARGPIDEAFDPLLTRAAYTHTRARDILEKLPIDRRSRIIGHLQNDYCRRELLDLVDSDIFAQATLSRFLSDAWWAEANQTRQVLAQIAPSARGQLEAARDRASGRRAELLDEAIAKLDAS